MPFEGFLGQIRNPSNDMPAYAAQVLPDQAVADIYAYVQSLPGPREPKDIAILKD
jgi:mono/diheme cytochrome c family protein